jgi:hypothetical protein
MRSLVQRCVSCNGNSDFAIQGTEGFNFARSISIGVTYGYDNIQ